MTRDALLIDLIAGARPNFMKIASITQAMDARKIEGGPLRYRLVHTGQHYDTCMSGNFFDQLNIPVPDVNLEVGSGTQAAQSAAIMIRYEQLLKRQPCELCLVVGDVNSTMACAITAQMQKIPVAHVEAGIRSGDWSMPEEINRMATDAISNWFFTTSRTANANLLHCGVGAERIFFVGNTMIDTLLDNMGRLRPPDFWQAEGLRPGGYLVATLHRPSNVDDAAGLFRMLVEISATARGLPVVFPAHPRTRKTLSQMQHLPSNIRVVDPQPYLEFNYLVGHALAVITDSGGITEETTVMGIPCMTLRDTTERPETVSIGTNEIVGSDPSKLKDVSEKLFAGKWKKGCIPEKWDGRAGPRIVAELERLLTP